MKVIEILGRKLDVMREAKEQRILYAHEPHMDVYGDGSGDIVLFEGVTVLDAEELGKLESFAKKHGGEISIFVKSRSLRQEPEIIVYLHLNEEFDEEDEEESEEHKNEEERDDEMLNQDVEEEKREVK